MSWFEYMSMPADDYFRLASALGQWNDGRREERESAARQEPQGRSRR